ncbi:flagellar biosynthesis regulator FlaF [Pararhodobacter aggregans]|uniref:Flagellar biosynthesis regulatory protein FlaF n=1 Tax=Pararhodobacter aggregans TaxID=404875 RepID=A0A2T7ULM8_9RHOB|nr:flagellar biosynthesis regulator FlaF [Pararhodobacter aggregans]PTW99847.1 flagellar protein FlaF [Pararhodobacter aggregans]PVE45548.1 flagellar biosynthesis regulatory protein FlaF [Pararhodobacter aggregans]
MSVAAYARTSYGDHARALKTPRDIEYDVLARITGRIQSELPHQPGKITLALTMALNDNRRLWATFATDLANPENGFPVDLRARLFSLAEFTLKHTTQVLTGRARADVLAEINTAVMRGLRPTGGARP